MQSEKKNREARLESIALNNFGPVSSIEVVIQGRITRLIGLNGSGKTTLTHKAFAAAFRGIAEKGNKGELIASRYQFIGPNGKSADVVVTIKDVKANAIIEVKNHIVASRNQLNISVLSGPENYQLDRDWVYSLFNEALISARKFASLSAKEQALALGIDTSAYDKEIKQLKESRKFVNREIKAFGEISEVKKIEKVSVSDLLQQQRIIDEWNRGIEGTERMVQEIDMNVEQMNLQIDDLTKKLEELNERKKDYLIKKSRILPIPEKKSTDHIQKQIEDAELINQQAAMYADYEQKKIKLSRKQNELNTIQKSIDIEIDKRERYIKGFKMPFKNMSIDDDNGLLLDGRPLNYDHYSAGEMEKIVALIGAAINPDLKLRFIDDFNLMDPDNQNKVLKALTDHGFDVIVNDVGDEKIDDNSILIRNGEIVD